MEQESFELKIPTFYPSQVKFLESTGQYIGFGGARGGGKSFVADWKLILLCLYNAGIKCFLMRKTMPELRENHINPLRRILNCASPDRKLRVAEYRESTKTFTFPNGSSIILGYCERPDDVFRYQGQAYEAIFLEEATLFEEQIFEFMKTCNRLSGNMKTTGFKPRMYFTANPGGVGHSWFKKLFIDNPKCNDGTSGIVFIKSLVYENTFLMENDTEYVKRLESLPEKQKQAFLYGDWDVFEGQFFEEFDPSKHVIEPFNIPTRWLKYRSRDYGMDMLACYWIAIDDNGNGYVYKEAYHPNLIISEAGNMINSLNGNDDIWLDLAPPDLFAKNKVDYRTTADIFCEESGHYLTKSSNDRIQGWNAVREWLKDVEEKIELPNGETIVNKHPKLRIFSTCTNLIRTLPLLIFDEKNPNDCCTVPHEITHAPDALRGFCISWSLAPDKHIVENQKSWFDQKIEEEYNRRTWFNQGGGYE